MISALLMTGWFFGGYIPQASVEWSQRDMFRALYEQKGPEDPIVGWWMLAGVPPDAVVCGFFGPGLSPHQ